MLKLKSFVGLLVLLAVVSSVSSGDKSIRTFVFDNEEVLTTDQELELDSIFREHQKRTTNQIVLVATPTYGDFENNRMFAVDFGNKLGVGMAKRNNGVVIVFSQTKREIFVATGLGTEVVLKDEDIKPIIDSVFIPKFKAGLVFEGLKAGSEAIVSFLEKPEHRIQSK